MLLRRSVFFACAGLFLSCADAAGDPDAGAAGVGSQPSAAGDSSGAGESGATSAAGRAADGGSAGAGGRAGAGGSAGAGGRAGSAGTGGTAGTSGTAGTGGTAGSAGSAGSADDAGARAGWKLIWRDEFDGESGSSPDASRWAFDVGGSGWGNNQLEFDTARPENASLDGKGELLITARKESYMGKSYSSARLKTQGKFEHTYGRYEARMRIPYGQGLWPAFWMLGADIGTNTWPACGEIDIMENVGKEPELVHGTLHGPGYSGGNGIGASHALPNKQKISDDYHVFAIEWEKDVVRWYVDDALYQTRKPSDLPQGAKWVYEHAFFVLINLAVGGQWPGNPDSSTMFPQTLRVDYVRVYSRD